MGQWNKYFSLQSKAIELDTKMCAVSHLVFPYFARVIYIDITFFPSHNFFHFTTILIRMLVVVNLQFSFTL